MTKLVNGSLERLREDLRLRRQFTMKAICVRYGISRTTAKRIWREMLKDERTVQFGPKPSQR